MIKKETKEISPAGDKYITISHYPVSKEIEMFALTYWQIVKISPWFKPKSNKLVTVMTISNENKLI